jgi:hypothetical protein
VFPHLEARVRVGDGIPHLKDSLSLLMVQYSKDVKKISFILVPSRFFQAVASTLQESPLAFKVPVSVAERFPVAPALSSPVDPVKHTLAISTRPVKENFDDADDNGNSDDVYDSEDDDEDSETRSQVARGDCGCECGCACSYEGGCEGGPGYVATTTAIPLKKPIKRKGPTGQQFLRKDIAHDGSVSFCVCKVHILATR